MKQLNLGGKNLETMSNSDAIKALAINTHRWGMQAVHQDGRRVKVGPKPKGWQYETRYLEAMEGFVLTQSINKFDTRLPKENEHAADDSKPAAKRPRRTMR